MALITRRAALHGALASCLLPGAARAASPAPVIVVGGGPAGLSAALTLAERGVPVTLLEASATLGGKVRGWTEPLGDEDVDLEHGVHGLNRGYVNMTDLLRRYGLEGALRKPEPLRSAFHIAGKERSLTPGQLLGFTAEVKRRAKARGVRHLTLSLMKGQRWQRQLTRPEARETLGGLSVTEWLGQSPPFTPFNMFSEMLSYSMYFVPPEQLDAATFAVAAVWNTPIVRWMRGNPQTLLWEPLGRALQAQGGKVLLQRPVRRLMVEAGAVVGVVTGDPEEVLRVPIPGPGWTQIISPRGEPVWLGRSPEGAPLALSGRCPHAQCPVMRAEAGFLCPCHGGRFGPEGQLLGGPPPRSLDPLPLVEDGSDWVVTLPSSETLTRGSAVILAVDAPAFARLCGDLLPQTRGLRGVRHTVARFWLDREVNPRSKDAMVCEDTHHTSNSFLLHQLQDKAKAWAQAHKGSVIEFQAFKDLPEADPDTLLDLLEKDLTVLWPELSEARVLKRTLTQGKEFTSFHPGWHHSASPVDTGVPGLYAAGDHLLVPELHEFMERAVTTGRQAANLALRRLGRDEAPVLSWEP